MPARVCAAIAGKAARLEAGRGLARYAQRLNLPVTVARSRHGLSAQPKRCRVPVFTRISCQALSSSTTTCRSLTTSSENASDTKKIVAQQKTVELQYTELPSMRDHEYKGDVLMILHGLLGSALNWSNVSSRHEVSFNKRVILVDLRNHGRSPHSTVHTYPAMAADVLSLLDRLQLDSVDVVGHSMGAKVAMTTALAQPERVRRLVSADMAPIAYHWDKSDVTSVAAVVDAAADVDMSLVRSREDADSQLAKRISSLPVRQFVLRNLVIDKSGAYRWRTNMAVLRAELQHMAGWEESSCQYAGPTLFVGGGKSNYLSPSMQQTVARNFPQSRIEMIPDAGHWLHVEKPAELGKVLANFLNTPP